MSENQSNGMGGSVAFPEFLGGRKRLSTLNDSEGTSYRPRKLFLNSKSEMLYNGRLII